MLDWDAPLSQQSPEVREAVVRAAKQSSDPFVAAYGKTWAEYPRASGEEIYRQMVSRIGESATSPVAHPDAIRAAGTVPATSLLRQSGIPGIRYLDGMSRGVGEGSRNYVVFAGEEDLLKILERNGVPIK
jgi:hypothetical protein